MTAARIHRIIPTALDGDPVECGALELSMVPPSLNHLFVNAKRGRVKAPGYRSWQALACLELRRHPAWHVPGAVHIRLLFNRRKTRSDLDNLCKGAIDALMACGRIADDRNVCRLEAEFTTAVAGTRIEIRRATAGKVAA